MNRQRIAERNRAGSMVLPIGQAEDRHWQRQPGTLAFPIKETDLGIFEVDHVGIVGGKWIARFHRGYISVQAVEFGHGFAKFGPLGGRRLLK